MNRILKKAVDLAKESSEKKYRFCSIITDKKNRILSVGFNSLKKSHPLQKEMAKKCGHKDKIYLHSEVSAIVNLDYGSKPFNIYVARVNKSGTRTMLAKPCDICSKLISQVSIKNIYYTRESSK